MKKVILTEEDADEYIANSPKMKGDVTSTPETDDVQNTKGPSTTYCANRKELLSEISIAQNSSDVNIADDTDENEVQVINGILGKYGARLSENEGSGSGSLNVVGCTSLVRDKFEQCGCEKTDFVFKTLSPIWRDYGYLHFQSDIVAEVFAFVDAYFDICQLNVSILWDHLSGRIRGRGTKKPSSPDDFLKEIHFNESARLSAGTATLNRYNMGLEDKDRLPDILNPQSK